MNWHEHFLYDESVPGCLVWNRFAANNRIKPGDIAGHYIPKKGKPDKGYHRVFVINRSYANHRIVWQMFNKPLDPTQQIDHKDGNTQNNVISNLRLVTGQENCYNQAKRTTNKSGITGVHKNDNGAGRWYWVASWMVDKKRTGVMFSIDVYGEDVARQMAIEARQNAVAKLKDSGINISERHGT